jgi:hypothetical protein
MTPSVLRLHSVDARTINVYLAVGMRIGRGNQCSRRIQAAVLLCPSQIPHELNGYRTRDAAVGSRQLIDRAVARPIMTEWLAEMCHSSVRILKPTLCALITFVSQRHFV